MTKTQLKESIKNMVRESIDEAGLTSESVPPGFGPGEKHEKVTKKIMAQYGANDPRTFATLQKIKKGMNEGTIDEASYKVVSPTQARCTKCNQALSIQTDPTMTEGTETSDDDRIQRIIINILKNINVDLKKLSQQQLIWKLDLVRSTLSSLINELPLKPDEDHRDYNDGHDGPDETDYDGVDETKKVSEAAYKTVAPRMATDAKEDKARRIQTEPKVNENSSDNSKPTSKVGSCGWENGKAWHHDHKTGKKVWSPNIKTGKIPKVNEPKVNETAYKVQGPSGKTFMDSSQLPQAQNNPKNA